MQKLRISILMVLTMVALTFVSCNKDEQYMNNAEIIGVDNSSRPCLADDPCNCPGGMYITIDNVSNPNGYSNFRAVQLPAGFTLGDHAIFPIAVKIDWKYDTAHACTNRIDVTRIGRR
jgi:hypothetical protein